ncbi:MAG: hypothetical protein PVH61_27445 [Candidatus Aminicenantes bacterium]|jgi:UDP-3-O-[3-hydroxymyristoyl] glucosamine N-acyltransferase
MNQDLILIGASGLCYEIIDTVFDINKVSGKTWNMIGIIDDDKNKWNKIFYRNIPIIGGKDKINNYNLSTTRFLVAFCSRSSYLKRATYVDALLKDYPGIKFAKILHPKANVSPSSTIGVGTFIGLGVIIDAKAIVGNHCFVLFNSVISRFVEIDDFTFISASVNITGHKKIGKNVFLGVKSTINAHINDNVLVSHGTIVMKEVGQNCIVSNPLKQDDICYQTSSELMTVLEQIP